MALSSGLRNLLLTAGGWMALGVTAAGAYVYYDDSKAVVAWLLGVPPPGSVAAMDADPADGSTPDPRETLEMRLRMAEARAAAAESKAKAYADGIAAHNAKVKEAQEQAATQRTRQSSSIQWDTQIRASRDGHYYAKARMNGAEIDVLIDTGASGVALTWEDARRIGINLSSSDFTLRTQTANGTARAAPITISDISVGNVSVGNVQGSVAEQGKLGITLLGMSFLGRLSRAEMRNGVLILQQ